MRKLAFLMSFLCVLVITGCAAAEEELIDWGDESGGSLYDAGSTSTPYGLRQACFDPDNEIYDDPDCDRLRKSKGR